MNIKNKIQGSLMGLAIGDALGAPLEFLIPPFNKIDNYIKGGIHNMSIGEWTDDTSMALCLAQSLIDNKGFNSIDQLDKYLDWAENAYFSTRNINFDIGITIQEALFQYKETGYPYCGIGGDSNSGNGSLMRLSPIALVFYKNINKSIEFAFKSSATTHKSEISIDACKLYVQLIINALKGKNKKDILNLNLLQTNGYRKEILNIIKGSYKLNKEFKPTGYVVNTLETALMAFYKYDNFIDGLLEVINLGHDADTVGAVYGQLAGAYYGLDSIPKSFVNNLMKKDLILEISNNLYHLSKDKKLNYNEIVI